MQRYLTTLLCAALLAGNGCAGTRPVSPPISGDYPLVDDFNYSTDAGARSEWESLWGAAEVRTHSAGARNVLAFPCIFKGNTQGRAAWDKAVNLDLVEARGLQFHIYCADTRPVSGFTFYLHSGNGWYSAGFEVASHSRWQKIRIRKADVRTEGNPAGWDRIDRIRVSAWRGTGGNTVFYLSSLGLITGGGEIAIIKCSSAAEADAEKRGAIRNYTRNVADFLGKAGISFSLISDLKLTPDRLESKKLVVLPYNPSFPAQALNTIESFIQSGGKLMCFYRLPARLEDEVGIELMNYRRQSYEGEFSSIRTSPAKIRGLPAEIRQRSGNIFRAEPVRGRSVPAAYWYDKHGRNSGELALLASDNCIFMTHVLKDDHPRNKSRMLLAMAGHFVPSIWQRAAESALNRAGSLTVDGNGPAIGQLRRISRRSGQARSYYRKAGALRKRARQRFSAGDHVTAVDLASQSREHLLKSYAASQQAEPGELRGLWCHNPFGLEGRNWQETVKLMHTNGFNALFANMAWGGTAFYRSDVLPVAESIKKKGDQINRCLEACRKTGVECHVWKVCFKLGNHAPESFLSRMRKENRIQKDRRGEITDLWLCPSHPENRNLEIAAMVEIASRYDVDGIHFDYIRYPDSEHCFCGRCRKSFESFIGRRITPWPDEVLEPKLRDQWRQFRRNNITKVVAAVSRQTRKARPDIEISAAVFPNWPVSRDSIGQDWSEWCKKGFLDFVCPMNYTPSTVKFRNLVRNQVKWSGQASLYPGIGLSTWETAGFYPLAQKIKTSRRLNTGGFTVFQLDPVTAEEVLPLCGLGLTAPGVH